MRYDEPIQRLTLADLERGERIHPPSVILGDCLDVMPHFKDKSIDAIITDLPYAITQNKWDSIIPFEPMWKEVKRVLKSNGVFITTASQPAFYKCAGDEQS